ncbi:MAG: DUF1598 domain-containing protein [Planctomycetota bacterium]|nr:DUF1598 domain-containing protein [Planctomycetota bacterium]
MSTSMAIAEETGIPERPVRLHATISPNPQFEQYRQATPFVDKALDSQLEPRVESSLDPGAAAGDSTFERSFHTNASSSRCDLRMSLMKSIVSRLFPVLSVVCCFAALGWQTTAHAQFGGGGGGVSGGQGGGQAGGQAGGQQGQQGGSAGGILIDAQGVVKPVFLKDPTGGLNAKRRLELAGKALPAEVNRQSPLRKVSLVQLEKACESFAKEKREVPPEMRYLAGLQRIDYVFVDPDERDIVIAGPAEGFVVDPTGKATGTSSRRATLRLDDLLVALRSQERGSGQIRCSIDPTDENLAKLQQFLKATGGAMTPDQARAKFAKLGAVLGMQTISVSGVPAESHFAQMLVEADIRMKRLSIGVDPPPVKGFRSHLDFVLKNENSMQRWWFTPLYDAFVRSEDGLAYQFSGQRVQLMSQEELIGPGGQRTDAPFTHVSAQKFAKQFTERFSEVAAAAPIFAELQNAIDLAVLAALMRREHLVERVGWKMDLFLDGERAPTGRENVPRTVASISNFKVANQSLYIAQVGGGVLVNADALLSRMEYRRDGEGELRQKRGRAMEKDAERSGNWWWD